MSRTLSWLRLIMLLVILVIIYWIVTGGLAEWLATVQIGAQAIMQSLVTFFILIIGVAGMAFVLSPAGRMGMAITALFLVTSTINMIYSQVGLSGVGPSVFLFHTIVTLPVAALSGFWMVTVNGVGDGFSKALSTYLNFWKELFALLWGVVSIFRVDPIIDAINKRRNRRDY